MINVTIMYGYVALETAIYPRDAGDTIKRNWEREKRQTIRGAQRMEIVESLVKSIRFQ
jgi:hypothetical protein